MSPSTRTSSSSSGQSFASAVSQLSHLNPSSSRPTQTYSLPTNKAVYGAQWGANNSNLGGVANLNVNLPNQGRWRASIRNPSSSPSNKAVYGAQWGANNSNLGGVANLNVHLPNEGSWRAYLLRQSDDGVSGKATVFCPASAPVTSPSTGIVPGNYDYYPIVWKPLANGWVKANSAGLISNGNPSVTTCGGLFRDSSGKFLGGFSQNLHVESSYFAEVMAAFLVIEHAYHKGWNNLWLETDSLLVVHLLTYHDVLYLPWSLRHKWMFDVQAKLPYMNFNFTCTFRENNRAAIFMAEIGRHRPELNWWNWWNIPDHEELVKILHHDSNGFPNHYIHE